MAKYNYSYKTENKNIGKAVMRDAPVSSKSTIEVCSNIRNKSVEKAKKILEAIKEMKTPIRMRRFTEGAGHKTGIGAGKYPVKAADNILKAVKSAESNAIDKGLSTNLKIIHISAQRAATPWHYGRQRRRKMKRTHIEVVLSEMEETKKPASKTQIHKPEEKQSEKETKNKEEVKQEKEIVKE